LKNKPFYPRENLAKHWRLILLGLFLIVIGGFTLIGFPTPYQREFEWLIVIIGVFLIAGSILKPKMPENREQKTKTPYLNDLTHIEAQYGECYESLRQHHRLIWELPSIASAISAGLLYVAFSLVPSNMNLRSTVTREALILIGVLLTFALLVAMYKHRYFSYIEEGTLLEIEKTQGFRAIRRRTNQPSDPYLDYWYEITPRHWFERRHAGKVLITVMWGLFLILVALLFHPLFI